MPLLLFGIDIFNINITLITYICEIPAPPTSAAIIGVEALEPPSQTLYTKLAFIYEVML